MATATPVATHTTAGATNGSMANAPNTTGATATASTATHYSPPTRHCSHINHHGELKMPYLSLSRRPTPRRLLWHEGSVPQYIKLEPKISTDILATYRREEAIHRSIPTSAPQPDQYRTTEPRHSSFRQDHIASNIVQFLHRHQQIGRNRDYYDFKPHYEIPSNQQKTTANTIDEMAIATSSTIQLSSMESTMEMATFQNH